MKLSLLSIPKTNKEIIVEKRRGRTAIHFWAAESKQEGQIVSNLRERSSPEIMKGQKKGQGNKMTHAYYTDTKMFVLAKNISNKINVLM